MGQSDRGRVRGFAAETQDRRRRLQVPAGPQVTLVEVAVHAQAVGYGGLQRLGLVGVLGGEADLQPVVDVQAPGRSRLTQLLEAAQAAVRHAHAERLAVWLVVHLPIVLPAVNQRVSCGQGGTGSQVRPPGHSPDHSYTPRYSSVLAIPAKQSQASLTPSR